MGTMNFRVYYEFNCNQFSIDFSMTGAITEETKRISALSEIKKLHRNITSKEVSNVRIENISVW